MTEISKGDEKTEFPGGPRKKTKWIWSTHSITSVLRVGNISVYLLSQWFFPVIVPKSVKHKLKDNVVE